MEQGIYPYGSVKNCAKCTYSIYRPAKQQYRDLTNTLKTTCPDCGYIWFESAADGSEPTPEMLWEEIKLPPVKLQHNDGSWAIDEAFENIVEIVTEAYLSMQKWFTDAMSKGKK